MKKLIAILIVVVLMATTLAMTFPVSAKNIKGVLYEALLTGPYPDGVCGEVKVYDDFQAKVKIQYASGPNAEYTVYINYGSNSYRTSEVLGTLTVNKNGNGTERFDLSWLPSSPLPPGIPELPPGSPTRIINPGFQVIAWGPPNIYLETSYTIPGSLYNW